MPTLQILSLYISILLCTCSCSHEPHIDYTSETPVIISIYPNDKGGFGEQHYKGLRAAISYLEKNQGILIDVIQLNHATLQEMKEGKVEIIKERLLEYLNNKNVIAIHGPPVTEFTKDVIEIVCSTGKNVPIFITSAAPRSLTRASSQQCNLPVFRLNSGIDDRAESISIFIDDILIHNSHGIVFLIEKNGNHIATFGETFYDYVYSKSRNISRYSDRIKIIKFNKNNPSEALEKLMSSGVFFSKNIIFLFGVGGQYSTIVDSIYIVNNNKRKPIAQFGGWMNAYAVDSKYRLKEYYHELLFEITDLTIDNSMSTSMKIDFERYLGFQINPSVRDIAFSFDIGYVIGEAYSNLWKVHNNSQVENRKYIYFNDIARSKFLSELEKLKLNGVSGNIGFSKKGSYFNFLSSLSYVRFNKSTNNWESIDYNKYILRNGKD